MRMKSFKFNMKLLIGIYSLLILNTNASANFTYYNVEFDNTKYALDAISPVKAHYTVGNYLRLRRAPSIENNIVTTLSDGWQPVTLLNENNISGISWSEIRTKDNQVGWLLSRFLNFIDPKNDKQVLESFKKELLSVNSYDNVRKRRIYDFYTQYYSKGTIRHRKLLEQLNDIFKTHYTEDLVLALVTNDVPLLVDVGKLNNLQKFTVQLDQWYLNTGKTTNIVVAFKADQVFDKNSSYKGLCRDPDGFGWCRAGFNGILSNHRIEPILHLSDEELDKIRIMRSIYDRNDSAEGGFSMHPEVVLSFTTARRKFSLIEVGNEDGSYYQLLELTPWNAKIIQWFAGFHMEDCMLCQ